MELISEYLAYGGLAIGIISHAWLWNEASKIDENIRWSSVMFPGKVFLTIFSHFDRGFKPFCIYVVGITLFISMALGGQAINPKLGIRSPMLEMLTGNKPKGQN